MQIPDFEIGMYPVTNRWYAEFVAAGGYGNQEFWTEEGWRFIQMNGITEPFYWHDRRWSCPNAPVKGVSWYEAIAFTNWWTQHRADGNTYRLPAEEEWQLASGGRKQTEYPWGDDWDEAKCNNGDLNLGRTSAVGIFHAGCTPVDAERLDHIFDMAGNVWEWTETAEGSRRVLRGGGWLSNARLCRSAYRDCDRPEGRGNRVGFRLVFVPSP